MNGETISSVPRVDVNLLGEFEAAKASIELQNIHYMDATTDISTSRILKVVHEQLRAEQAVDFERLINEQDKISYEHIFAADEPTEEQARQIARDSAWLLGEELPEILQLRRDAAKAIDIVPKLEDDPTFINMIEDLVAEIHMACEYRIQERKEAEAARDLLQRTVGSLPIPHLLSYQDRRKIIDKAQAKTSIQSVPPAAIELSGQSLTVASDQARSPLNYEPANYDFVADKIMNFLRIHADEFFFKSQIAQQIGEELYPGIPFDIVKNRISPYLSQFILDPNCVQRRELEEQGYTIERTIPPKDNNATRRGKPAYAYVVKKIPNAS